VCLVFGRYLLKGIVGAFPPDVTLRGPQISRASTCYEPMNRQRLAITLDSRGRPALLMKRQELTIAVWLHGWDRHFGWSRTCGDEPGD
jgi:hypothetical protein